MATARHGRMPRQHYTQDDDKLLAKYLSKYAPRPQGRSGNLVYKTLVEDADRKWSWSKNHTWQSWRERYCKNKDDFDRVIRRYQLRKDKQSESTDRDRDRGSPNAEAAEEEERSPEQLERQQKRRKRKADDVQDGHRDKRGKVDEVSAEERPQKASKASPAVEPNAPDTSRHETTETEEDGDRNVPMDRVESNTMLLSQPDTSTIRDQREEPVVPTEDGKIYPKLDTLSPPQLPGGFEPDVLQSSVPLLTVDTQRRSIEVIIEAEKQKEPSGLGKTTSPLRRMPSTTQPTVQRKVQRRSNHDEDFFASSSSPQPSTTRTPLKSQPRQIVEGPFRTSFESPKLAQASESEGVDESRTDFKPSAPTSAKGKGEEISEPHVITIPASQVDRPTGVDTRATRPVGSIHGELTTATITERSKLPESFAPSEHHPFSQPPTMHRIVKHPPSQLNGHVPVLAPLPASRASSHAGGTPVQSASKEGQVPSSSRASSSNLRPTEAIAGRSEEHATKRESAPPEPLDGSPILRMPLTRQAVTSLAGPSATRPTLGRFESSREEVERPSMRFPTPENPFIAKHGLARGKGKQREKVPAPTLFNRRHTIGSMDSHELPPFRLNGRQSLPSRLSISTSASTSASGGQRRKRESLLPVEVAEEDRAKVDYLGMSTAVAMMAKNFAFREEVVWRAWELTGSIAKTEEFLGRLRAKTEDAAAEILEDMEQAGEIVFPSYVDDDAEPRINLADVLSAPARKSDSSPLHIMPPPPDDDVMSDYTPPPSSRAGQLLRLARQGRLEEAIKREARRASGANRYLQRIDVPQESVSRDAPRQLKPGRDSPTPSPRGRPETPNQSTVLRTDSSPSSSPSKPRMLKWTAELETAFMSAKQDDLERLREIEQQLDPDFLRRWTASKLANVKRRPDWKPFGRRS